MKDKVCYNCAFCSEYYPSFKDECDNDGHEIKDIFLETCKNFEMLNETED